LCLRCVKVREVGRSHTGASFRSPFWSLVPRSRAQAIDDALRRRGGEDDLDQKNTTSSRPGRAFRTAGAIVPRLAPLVSESRLMAKSRRPSRSRGPRVPRQTVPTPRVVHPDAAGIDVGATHLFVALPPERSDPPVRVFETFTEDLVA